MKSLELNWIRRKCDKSIPMPEVVYYPLSHASGKYYHPEDRNELYDADGMPHSMKYGVIVINSNSIMMNTTIAHEWRHHWQYYNGIEFEIGNPPDANLKKEEYEKGLKKYFTDSKTEWDAIRFEYKYAGTYPEWEKPLYHILKDLMVHPLITYGNTTLNKQKIHSRSSVGRHSYTTNKKARRI